MKNIDIDIVIDMVLLENIDIDKGILQNIDINKILYRLEYGISNRAKEYCQILRGWVPNVYSRKIPYDDCLLT